MSATAIAGTTLPEASGVTSAAERVAQLQALIARAAEPLIAGEAGSSAGDDPASSTSASDFSDMLAQASAQAPSSSSSGVPYEGDQAAESSAAAAYDASQPIGAATDPAYAAVLAAAGTTTEAPDMTGLPATSDAAVTGAGGSSAYGSSAYEGMIDQAAARYGIDPAILHGLIQQESDFDPNAQSSAGALGLTQLMPGTASAMGVTEPLNPQQSIEGGARYLSEMMSSFDGNVPDAIAAYNAGPGAVSQYGGIPPYAETESYVSKVLENAAAYRAAQADTGGATT